jgi:hypothetical protein
MNSQLNLRAILVASCLNFGASHVSHLSDNDRLAGIVNGLLFKSELLDSVFRKISKPAFHTEECIGIEGVARDGMSVTWKRARDEHAIVGSVGCSWIGCERHHGQVDVSTGSWSAEGWSVNRERAVCIGILQSSQVEITPCVVKVF